MAKPEISIVGAGLVGSLFALQMRQLGHPVKVYEKRKDMRLEELDGGRSINLVVTSRGINAARLMGIEKEVLDITVPVTGRMIHSVDGEKKFQRYGRDDSECNYSISRAELNKLLMTLAEKSGAEFQFEAPLKKMDVDSTTLTFESGDVKTDVIVGADGGGSEVRNQFSEFLNSKNIEHRNDAEWLESEYKELLMPLKPDGSAPLETHALHIWPRGSHMLMALPNLDGSFTMTIYLPTDSDISFAKLDTDEKVMAFMEKYYASSLPFMPDFLQQWNDNPVGKLGTIRCDQWVFEDKVALVGDAAHAIVPFFGQGMNCGFEDCAYLLEYYNEFDGDLKKTFEKYNTHQIKNGWAIADMALENYHEMQDKVGDDRFLLRKAVEHTLETEFPTAYRARYGMVTYTLIPYHLAQQAGKIQDEILEQIVSKMMTLEDLDLTHAKSLIEGKFAQFLRSNEITLERFK